MSSFQRLIQQLPAERRVEAALVLQKIAHDPDSPIYRLYEEIITEQNDRFKELNMRLEASDAEAEHHNKVRDKQFSEANSNTQQTIRQEINSLTHNGFLHQIIANKIIGAIIWTVCWIVGSYLLIDARMDSAMRDFDKEQFSQLDKLAENPQGIVDFANASLRAADKSNDTAATLAGIATLLSTPEAVMAVRDGKLILKIRKENIEFEEKNGSCYLTIHQDIPQIFNRVEDHLNEADDALQTK